jgi:hypothetical protein
VSDDVIAIIMPALYLSQGVETRVLDWHTLGSAGFVCVQFYFPSFSSMLDEGQ